MEDVLLEEEEEIIGPRTDSFLRTGEVEGGGETGCWLAVFFDAGTGWTCCFWVDDVVIVSVCLFEEEEEEEEAKVEGCCCCCCCLDGVAIGDVAVVAALFCFCCDGCVAATVDAVVTGTSFADPLLLRARTFSRRFASEVPLRAAAIFSSGTISCSALMHFPVSSRTSEFSWVIVVANGAHIFATLASICAEHVLAPLVMDLCRNVSV